MRNGPIHPTIHRKCDFVRAHILLTYFIQTELISKWYIKLFYMTYY